MAVTGERAADDGAADGVRPPDAQWLERLDQAVAVANVPSLLMVLVQLTGETRWLEAPYRPLRGRGLGDNDTGGLPEVVQDEIRRAAAAAIADWRAGRPVALAEPSESLLVAMLSAAMSEEVPLEYGPMLADEARAGLASPEEASVPFGAAAFPTVPEGFRAVVIGAGVGGLCAAVNLRAAGIPYVVLERNDTVGGTWLENSYPGAGVDTPNHLYSFSFAPFEWRRYFSLRDELHNYLEHVSREFEVRSNIRFGCEVVSATYHEPSQSWRVDYRDPAGTPRQVTANLLISAVGAFNPPRPPDIPGVDDFTGDCYHTARWPADAELDGRRVGVIGTGASAMQLVPQIADRVAELTIFQRSPQWAAPFEQFRKEVPEPVRFLLNEVPLYRTWYRMRLGWTFNDRIHPALQKDPEWEHPARAVNAQNDAFRRFFTRYVQDELGERTDLLDAVLPTYPPYGKRILLDNGWFAAVCRDNVTLVPEAAASVAGNRVRTASGGEHELDVLILATGFDVSRFVSTYEVRGRSGQTLQEAWHDDDGRAYLGCTVPDFPNFFTLYGPNLQAGHGGSLMFFLEAQMTYVMGLVRQMVDDGIGAIELRRQVCEAYNSRLDELHESMIWTHPGMETYYRNSKGRVVVPTPLRVIDFWSLTRQAELEHYQLEPASVRGG